MINISVVVPAYNAEKTLAECLQSLCNQTLPSNLAVEIIVVDNGSTDSTAAVAARFPVQLITESRKGASWARNAGIEAASGELICFTDADCIPTPTWIDTLTAPLIQDPSITGGKGVYLTQQTEPVARFVQLEYEDKYDLLAPQPRIDFIDTYSAIYRREALVTFGGFDPEMTYLEDQELSFRLNQQGCQMIFIPEAVVYHYHSDSLLSYFRKKITIGYWKAQVIRKYPQHLVKDSHTPQVMKIQMGLSLLTTGALGLPILRWLLARHRIPAGLVIIPFLIGLVTFVGTSIPFVMKALPKDRSVALRSPAYLFARAAALSIGYIIGVLRPVPFQSTATETPQPVNNQ